MVDEPQKKKHDEQFVEKAKERLKTRKEKAKKKRPEYKKKRVFVPVITAVILVLMGIFPCSACDILPINGRCFC